MKHRIFMKHRTFVKHCRFLSLLLALSFTLSMFNSTGVLASELKDSTAVETESIPMDTSEITPYTTSFGPGDWYWGGVTFTDTNAGAYKTINGNQVKIKVAFKAVDGDPFSYHLYLSLVQYGGKVMYSRDYNSWSVTPDSDGYLYYEADWIDIKKGVDYRFFYGANSECACDDPRRLSVHIWIEVR